jgi:hypothetical protein
MEKISLSTSELFLNELSTDKHFKFITNPHRLKDMSVQQFTAKANKVLLTLAQEQQLNINTIRALDASVIEHLLNELINEQSLTLVMRHGDQEPLPAIATQDTARKKIIMMQKLHNEKDPITLASAVEFCATIMTLSYLNVQTSCNIAIESSKNTRARQPAVALGHALGTTNLNYHTKWTCINYPEDKKLYGMKLDRYLNGGTLPWQQQSVDAIVGKGTYTNISSNMQSELNLVKKAHELKIIITHSQQTQSICQQSNLAVKRLNNYGFIAIAKNKQATLNANGFYDDTMTLQALLNQTINKPFFHDRKAQVEKVTNDNERLSFK